METAVKATMKINYTKLLNLLKIKFDSYYDEYIGELMELNAEQLIERASEIVAIKETYYEVRFWIEVSLCKFKFKSTPSPVPLNRFHKEPISEHELEMLLSTSNPLIELGLKWWFYNLVNKMEFQGFYNKLDENVGNEGNENEEF